MEGAQTRKGLASANPFLVAPHEESNLNLTFRKLPFYIQKYPCLNTLRLLCKFGYNYGTTLSVIVFV